MAEQLERQPAVLGAVAARARHSLGSRTITQAVEELLVRQVHLVLVEEMLGYSVELVTVQLVLSLDVME